MKIILGAPGITGITTIEDAEGVVWDEEFTFEQCEEIAELLERQLVTEIPTSLLLAVKQLRDVFFALANDGDACVIHCTSTVGCVR